MREINAIEVQLVTGASLSDTLQEVGELLVTTSLNTARAMGAMMIGTASGTVTGGVIGAGVGWVATTTIGADYGLVVCYFACFGGMMGFVSSLDYLYNE